ACPLRLASAMTIAISKARLMADDTGDRRVEAIDVGSKVAPISTSPLVWAVMGEPEVALVRCHEAHIRGARGKEVAGRIQVCFGADDHVVCDHGGTKIVADGLFS